MQTQLHEQINLPDREVKRTRVLRNVYLTVEKIIQICDIRLKSSEIVSQNVLLKSVNSSFTWVTVLQLRVNLLLVTSYYSLVSGWL